MGLGVACAGLVKGYGSASYKVIKDKFGDDPSGRSISTLVLRIINALYPAVDSVVSRHCTAFPSPHRPEGAASLRSWDHGQQLVADAAHTPVGSNGGTDRGTSRGGDDDSDTSADDIAAAAAAAAELEKGAGGEGAPHSPSVAGRNVRRMIA